MPRKKQPVPENQWQVPKSYAVHFQYSFMGEYLGSIYGIKKLDELDKIVTEMKATPKIIRLWWSVSWKETKMGKWHRQEYIVDALRKD